MPVPVTNLINTNKTLIVKRKIAAAFLGLVVLLAGCSKKNDAGGGETPPATPPPAIEAATPNGEVMFQPFYWDVPAGGTWWDHLNGKLDGWKSAGFTALWLPPITKGQSGQFSMGYDPYDYFDFGKYNQMGSVETRFGSDAELRNLLRSAKSKGFKLIADIVLNHNSGGESEFSPHANRNYWTKFTPLSGKFNRNYEHFHPNAIHASDEDKFGGFPDLCHHSDYVKNWFWGSPESVGRYYRDSLGFDGWRFDFVKGFSPDVVKQWNTALGGISIAEFWDGNLDLVKNYVNASGSAAFDFPLMYALKDALNGADLTRLNDAGLVAVNPTKAYTFIANHDVDEIFPQNKLKAYAYILTSEGVPFVFYKDYETGVDQGKMNELIRIRKQFAAGSTTRLFSSRTEYVFRRNGTPGLVTYISNEPVDVQRKVQTTWAGRVLKDQTGANPDVTTDASGFVTLACKANSYAVYAPK